MSFLEPPELPQPKSPYAFIGAASPLWGYFGVAAAGAVAYWWMTRWARPVNLEALLGVAAEAPVTPALVEAAVEIPVVIGGEAAPISPILAAPEPIAEPEPEPAIEPEAPPPAVEAAAPEPETVEPEVVEPAPVEAAAPEPAVIEAVSEPEPAPVAEPAPAPTPRPRRAPRPPLDA